LREKFGATSPCLSVYLSRFFAVVEIRDNSQFGPLPASRGRLTSKLLRNPYFCRNLSTQYSASHEAYEIQITGLTRSLAQMEEQLRLANEDRVSLKPLNVRALFL